MWVVSLTFGTSYIFSCGNSCISWGDIQENTSKVSHEGGPILHEGDSYIKNGPESSSKVVLTALELLKARLAVHGNDFDGFLSK